MSVARATSTPSSDKKYDSVRQIPRMLAFLQLIRYQKRLDSIGQYTGTGGDLVYMRPCSQMVLDVDWERAGAKLAEHPRVMANRPSGFAASSKAMSFFPSEVSLKWPGTIIQYGY